MRTKIKYDCAENILDNTVQDIQKNKIKLFLYNLADQVYIFIGFSFGCGIKFIRVFINITGIYLIWIFLHYIASHLYVRMCVPSTVIGFLLSPFMTATPHCQGLRWIVFNAANMINNMWIILGSWIMSNILVVTRDTTTP
uniref:Uncharacterized protein n=1 Tax=viral metagenome TaxID=1070528 RepID=A0A6C0AR13_9ZZZZ